jgi:hypothetical protein
VLPPEPVTGGAFGAVVAPVDGTALPGGAADALVDADVVGEGVLFSDAGVPPLEEQAVRASSAARAKGVRTPPVCPEDEALLTGR